MIARILALAAIAAISLPPPFIARAATATGCASSGATPLAPRLFAFPRDDGAHERFPTEWWRTFGRMNDASGKRYDFSVNVSRFRASACDGIADARGRWTADDVVTTSWELLDESAFVVRRGSHTEREGAIGARLEPASLGIATDVARFKLARAAGKGGPRFSLAVDDRENGMALEQTPDNPLPLGPGGIMRTGSCAACQAYAYAYPRSATRGTLRIAGVSHTVTGSTWIEHEFARRELAAADAGWNRYELQFDDGRDLDVRFTHDARGRIVETAGTFVDAHGAVTYLHDGDARVQNVMHTVWRSNATGVTYPSLWALTVRVANFYLATVELALDQETRDTLRTPYFTGAIVAERVGPPEADHAHGYVELTGYGAPVSL